MKFKIISFKEEDVDLVFIDFYTIGHFIFGYITCLILYLIIGLLFKYPESYGLCITISISIGLFWEFLENFCLYNTGFKYDNRIDSLANSLTDILFVNIGAIVCGIVCISKDILGVFIESILILMVCLVIYEFLRRITFREKNNHGKNVEKV